MAHIIPKPPLWVKTIDCGWVVFKSGNDDIRGYLAKPRNRSAHSPAIIVLHENIGLIEHKQDYTRRLAEQGYVALTVDLFSRIGGRPPKDFTTPDERRAAAFKAANDEQAIRDADAGLDYLLEVEDVDPARIGAIGYCSGGGTLLAWICGGTTKIRAAVAFYPNIVVPAHYRPDGKALSRLPVIPRLSCPLQIHFGADDESIPQPQRVELESSVAKAPWPVEFYNYPGANHAYMDDSHSNYHAEAAKLSWSSALAFLAKHLAVKDT